MPRAGPREPAGARPAGPPAKRPRDRVARGDRPGAGPAGRPDPARRWRLSGGSGGTGAEGRWRVREVSSPPVKAEGLGRGMRGRSGGRRRGVNQAVTVV
jgi:hypothetical protein